MDSWLLPDFADVVGSGHAKEPAVKVWFLFAEAFRIHNFAVGADQFAYWPVIYGAYICAVQAEEGQQFFSGLNATGFRFLFFFAGF